MSTGLYIGRFQPLHLGHLSAIRQALNEVDTLYIGIGSTQYKDESQNPLSGDERALILKSALKEAGIHERCSIYLIPDIHDDAGWTNHVRKIVPAFETLFIGNEGLVAKLFEGETKIQQLKHEVDISATKIRQDILNGKPWKTYISPKTMEYLESMGFEERVQKLAA